ncbi:MAG: hypothetical protein K6B68_02845 [Eubacterium sp.]|nr:hypothetical protein [Eubacterium sp.]
MKKIIIIFLSVFVGMLLISALIFGIQYYRSFTRLFKDTDYPVCYKQEDGNISITLKDKSGSKVMWYAEAEDADYISIEEKGKAKAEKTKYIISPKSAGITVVNFAKRMDVGGVSVDEAVISFNVYISEDEETGSFRCDFLDFADLSYGDYVIGADTSNPIILCGKSSFFEDDYSILYASDTDADKKRILGNIDFVNGKGDWQVEADNNAMMIKEFEEGNRTYCYLYLGSTDPREIDEEDHVLDEYRATASNATAELSTETDATEVKGETVLQFASESLGIGRKIKVTVFKDGHMTFSDAEEK